MHNLCNKVFYDLDLDDCVRTHITPNFACYFSFLPDIFHMHNLCDKVFHDLDLDHCVRTHITPNFACYFSFLPDSRVIEAVAVVFAHVIMYPLFRHSRQQCR